MCAQNPHRRCSGNFSTKYLSGDVLKAKCGASIRVEVVRSSNFEPVRGSAIEDIYLEVSVPPNSWFVQPRCQASYDIQTQFCKFVCHSRKIVFYPISHGTMPDSC